MPAIFYITMFIHGFIAVSSCYEAFVLFRANLYPGLNVDLISKSALLKIRALMSSYCTIGASETQKFVSRSKLNFLMS